MSIEKVLKRGLSRDWTNTKKERKGIEIILEQMKGGLFVKGD